MLGKEDIKWQQRLENYHPAYQANPEIRGSRDATRQAFKVGLITNDEVWMDMIISRNKTTHTYDEKTAREITDSILKQYVELFNDFKQKMDNLRIENI